MTEREPDDSTQPRKRIAVACGRCRKRKIRCSGENENGGQCSNCKNAGHEPCLFLRVSSTETPMRDGGDFGYNVEAARAYHARGAVSPHNTVSQYADMSTGDMMAYRGGTYPSYSSKGYYSTVSGWGGAYPEDGADYSLNYSSYPHLNQDPVHLVHGYRYGSSSKAPVYVDTEASTYSYGNLVHRPAANSDLPNFSLSGMAASLPTPSDRLPSASRTLPSSSSYRADGLSGSYSGSKASTSQSSDVGYGSFDSYGATATLPSNLSTRSSQSEAGGYDSASGAADDGLYGSEHPSYRSVHATNSYIYSDRLDSSRRDSQSSGGASTGSILSNGQVYLPESQPHAVAHGYPVSGAATDSQAGEVETATAATGAGGSRATSRVPTGRDRRAAGSLRGI
ncbi:hypothetical protein JX266_011734 [Neoarthrinium moseri]|uniref:uncharacterized protein n=1 Tax=Neoarthrinium moseri TaxID=1658444 RepID=UPI001FDD3C44|nr:uncharacterized protein JN550_002906 [Neoarthrinium moseri]KAI1842083.1 hypothetical protein JX266_011734 [Neoarthrinium moseri]KAI1874327.1 hypothetical protein JN550_002906 [Neoarthrinium moseri]